MKMNLSHSMPYLNEDSKGVNKQRNAFDIIISYMNSLIQDLHCSDTMTQQSNDVYLNEISKCNLDSQCLLSCKRLLKGISIYHDKVNVMKSQMQSRNDNGYSNLKDRDKENNAINSNSLRSYFNQDDNKRFEIHNIISDTNRHAKNIEKQLENIKSIMNSKRKDNAITFQNKLLDLNKEDDDDNHIEYFEKELRKLNRENKALKVELRFIYEQLHIEGKINVLPNNSKRNTLSQYLDDNEENNEDTSFNQMFFSDICFKLNNDFKDNTWVSLKAFIEKLKANDYYI